MKYGDVKLGQVEAIINGLGGAPDGVNRFLSSLGTPRCEFCKEEKTLISFGVHGWYVHCCPQHLFAGITRIFCKRDECMKEEQLPGHLKVEVAGLSDWVLVDKNDLISIDGPRCMFCENRADISFEVGEEGSQSAQYTHCCLPHLGQALGFVRGIQTQTDKVVQALVFGTVRRTGFVKVSL
ncbi:MAG: hypothetical protein HY505_00775 [Candidatus Yanofskybacteria bacterium]|nr:hypothetical protein [Candidatus Yanofskybacteria bacterium]